MMDQTAKADDDAPDYQDQQLSLVAEHAGYYVLCCELRAALNYAGWIPLEKFGRGGRLNPQDVDGLLGEVIHRLADQIRFGEDFALSRLKPRKQKPKPKPPEQPE